MLFAIMQDPSSKLLRGREKDLETCARALKKQLNDFIEPAWDWAFSDAFYEPDPESFFSNEPHAFPIVLLDSPDVPSALGYHAESGAKVFIEPSLKMGSGVLTGPYAISGVIIHEGAEARGDRSASLWGELPGGTDRVLVAERLHIVCG